MAAYLVPQVMAYATVAGVAPVVGLWAALPALVVYPLLGSSRSLSMGPEATTALMTAIAIGPLAAGHSQRYAALAASLALLVGVMALAAWLLRLGFVADLLSRPVLVGYMAGLALIMIADQLQRVTGIPVTGQSFTAQAISFSRSIGELRPATALISAAVLAFLLLVRWRWPHAPGSLLALLLATAFVAVSDLTSRGIGVVGTIPAALPVPALPDIHPHDLRLLLLPAFTVLIVGFSDDVLTAVVCPPWRGDPAQSGVAGPGRRQCGVELAARIPGQQQRDQDVDRHCRREPHSAVLADRGRIGAGRLVVPAAGAGAIPYRRARRDRHLRGHPAD